LAWWQVIFEKFLFSAVETDVPVKNFPLLRVIILDKNQNILLESILIKPHTKNDSGGLRMRLRKGFSIRPVIFIFFIAFVSGPAVTGEIIYVDGDAAGANDGSGWVDAYNYLQDALAEADFSEKPVEIRVGQGVYKPDRGGGNTPGDREATFQLINGVSIKGGYAGFGEPEPNERNIELYETILSGDLNGDDMEVAELFDLPDEPSRAENSYHIVTGSGTDETAVLDGFRISGGNANGEVPASAGGGLYDDAGSPMLIDCTFNANSARDDGGGMFNLWNSNPSLIKCIFSKNSADWNGGGMYNWMDSSPTLTDCTFSGNSGQSGGGMANEDNSNSTLINCIFISNSSETGGGMVNTTSSPTLTDCTFDGNSSKSGGGMVNSFGSNSILTGCIFEGNFSSGAGGGMENLRDSSPAVINCRFIENSAAWDGGGMSNKKNSNPTLTNCIFAGNTAVRSGGGMYNDFSSPQLTHCTFSGNSARLSGGIKNLSSEPILSNCILWGDMPDELDSPASVLQWATFPRYCNIQGGCPGEGNIDSDPLFADANSGDYHLKSEAGRWDPTSESWVKDDVTSPGIDAGEPNSPVAFEPFPNGGIVNMGAYGGTAEASKSPSGVHGKYGGGTGEPNNPYLIYTAEHMNSIGAEPNDGDRNFRLMADIDLSGITYSTGVIPVFAGTLEGNFYTVSNLTIVGGDHIGLIGTIQEDGKVWNLGVVDANLVGTDDCIGILAGENNGDVFNSFGTGTVGGGDAVGGLVGRNYGDVTCCYSAGRVTGSGWGIGGLVGYNGGDLRDTSHVIYCYSTVTVSGNSFVGGLVGGNLSSVVSQCYSTGAVSGVSLVGGLVGGVLSQDVVESFWDIETSGLTSSKGGIGKTTAEMQTAGTFLKAGWDFVGESENGTEDIWWILEGQDYPRLWWELNEDNALGLESDNGELVG
jgi:hypothetical protein